LSYIVPSTTRIIGADGFAGAKNLRHIEISEGVTTIEAYAFSEECGAIIITLPSTLTTITPASFGRKTYKSALIFTGTVPPEMVGDDTFEVSNCITMYFPEGTTEDYLTKWNKNSSAFQHTEEEVKCFCLDNAAYDIIDDNRKYVKVMEVFKTPYTVPTSVTWKDQTYFVVSNTTCFIKNKGTGAYLLPVLSGTSLNCSTTPTPWPFYIAPDGNMVLDGSVFSDSEDSNFVKSWQFMKNDNGYVIYTVQPTFDAYLKSDDNNNCSWGNVDSDASYWQVLSPSQIIDELPSNSGIVDATYFIDDPGFDKKPGLSQWQFVGGHYDITNSCAESFNTNIDIFQEIKNVPNGIYKLEMQGFYRAGAYYNAALNSQHGTEQLNSYLYANDSKVAIQSIFDYVTSESSTGYVLTSLGYIPDNMYSSHDAFSKGQYDDNSLMAEVKDHTLRIGVKNDANNNLARHWTIFDNFRLTYYKTKDITDGVAYTTDENEYNIIRYSRTFKNTNWQALYVPFSMSYDDWKEDFEVAKINDVNMYDTNDDGEIDETEVEIIKVKRGTLKPNHPYMIKAKTKGDKTIMLQNATLYPAAENSLDMSSAEIKFTFTGTHSGVTGSEMVSNKYYALAGGALAYTEDTNASLKPGRWYMKIESRGEQVILPSANNSRIRVKVFGEDEEETGIEEFEAVGTVATSNVVYSLDGRVASTNGIEGLRSGIYISDGKKVLVK